MADGWKRGLPPGKYYPGMADDYDVYFSPAGFTWHRKQSAMEKEKVERLFALAAALEHGKKLNVK